MNPKESESLSWTEIMGLKKHLRNTRMRAVVPPHLDVAVLRPAHVAREVVAKFRKGLPTVLAEGPLSHAASGLVAF